MKTTTLLCLASLAASCGAAPDTEEPKAEPLCVFDPSSINQPARVLSAGAADSRCEYVAAAAIADGTLDVENGRVFNLPLAMTRLASYDARAIGATCAYDIQAMVRLPVRFDREPDCAVTFDLALWVVQP